MGQDLRELLKDEKNKKYAMKKGHEERFIHRLDKDLPQHQNPSFINWRIAAVILLLAGLGVILYWQSGPDTTLKTTTVSKSQDPPALNTISLGDLSPDLKRVEHYYVANINLELAGLSISNENKALVDSFMERLAVLNTEYKNLNLELNEIGPNDQTITALIKNLQLRLQLLHKLKEKLNQLKSSENETVTTNSI